MKRIYWVWMAAVLIASGLAPKLSLAQDPAEVLQHYRLVPRLSVLHQSGGFAGVNRRYRLSGEYDFRHELSRPATADFENAEIWGALISDLPTPAFVIDVDEILKINGLEGKLLPFGGPLDLYEFRGKTGDGSTIHAHAAVLGRWMYMRGNTQPPPNSADFFTHHFQTLARSGPFADFDDNGTVDAADFVAMRDKEGRAIRGDLAMGAGVSEWRQQFGEAVPDLTVMDKMLTSALSSFVDGGSVPEPAALSLAICGVLSSIGLRRRLRRSV